MGVFLLLLDVAQKILDAEKDSTHEKAPRANICPLYGTRYACRLVAATRYKNEPIILWCDSRVSMVVSIGWKYSTHKQSMAHVPA